MLYRIVIMADKTDKLQLLRTRYLERIRDIERTLSELKSKVSFIDELESESAKLENGEPVVEPIRPNGAVTTYAATGLTDAILDAVKLLGAGSGVSAGKVAVYLLGNGFKPKGKNHNISVSLTLRRLAKDRIATVRRHGARLYMPKTE